MKKQILLLVMIIAVAGVISGCQKKTKNNTNHSEIFTPGEQGENMIITSSGNEVVATSTDEIDTKEWKIYKDKTMGIEFNYPQNWECNDASKYIPLADGAVRSIDCKLIQNNEVEVYIGLLTEYKADSPCERLSHYNTSFLECKVDTNYPNIDQANTCRCDGIIKTEGSKYDSEQDYIGVVIIKDNKLFDIQSYIRKNSIQKNIVEKILKSIKIS